MPLTIEDQFEPDMSTKCGKQEVLNSDNSILLSCGRFCLEVLKQDPHGFAAIQSDLKQYKAIWSTKAIPQQSRGTETGNRAGQQGN